MSMCPKAPNQLAAASVAGLAAGLAAALTAVSCYFDSFWEFVSQVEQVGQVELPAPLEPAG